jgi:hypothetical protein
VAGSRYRRAALGLALAIGVSAGSVAVAGCTSSGASDVPVEGTRVDAPDAASLNGSVVDGQGWDVQIVLTSGTRHFTTTASANGDYTFRGVPTGTATLQWTATARASGGGGASVGDARRDGTLRVDLTPGANHADIQL